MPIPIKFGTKEITKKTGEGEKEKEVKETVDNIININEPAWTKKPKDLKEDDYKTFYKDFVSQSTLDFSSLVNKWEKSGALKNLLELGK